MKLTPPAATAAAMRSAVGHGGRKRLLAEDVTTSPRRPLDQGQMADRGAGHRYGIDPGEQVVEIRHELGLKARRGLAPAALVLVPDATPRSTSASSTKASAQKLA